MKSCFFITGTDTEIGKTFVSCALLHRARADGLSAVALKPIAAGTDAHGDNEDVLRLQAASSLSLPRDIINPYCFVPPIAPHIAAAEAGVEIDFARIAATVDVARQAADVVLVEGVGGFRVPLGGEQDTADLAVHLGLPVILVVGLRLGCLNHALLTAEAILARPLRLAGWVANQLSPDMPRQQENIAALTARLSAPCLGVLPHAADAQAASVAQHLAWPAVN